jgi:urease accessory protein
VAFSFFREHPMKLFDLAVFAAVAAFLLPAPAFAHVGAGHTSGIGHGILHPILGIDHLTAMVAVGVWAAQLGNRAVWSVPLTFVSVMSLGGLLGALGMQLPMVEPMILSSLLVLGILIAFAVRLPLVATSFIVGLFALFHGHAHGSEMPETISGLAYGLGFVLATASLHLLGIGFGLVAQRLRPNALRYAGGLVVAVGLYLVTGV